MIYCPTCETANRDGSKYCNECGIKFDPRMQKCSQCGALNPVEDVACEACGESLPAQLPLELRRASSRAEGGMDTSIPPDHASVLPIWLHGLPVPATDEVPQGEDPGEETVEPESLSGSPAREGEAAGTVVDQPPQPVQAPHYSGATAGGMLLQFLAGLEDGLPAEPLITQARVALAGAGSDSGASSQDTEQSASKARLFAEIVTPQQKIQSRPTSRPPSSWLSRLPRWLL